MKICQSKSTQNFIDCSNQINVALKRLDELHLDVIDVFVLAKTIKISVPPIDFKPTEIGGFKSLIKSGIAVTTAQIGNIKIIYEQAIISKNGGSFYENKM